MQGGADVERMVQQQTSELAVLREQCSNHAKERAALKTILDAKIKALVDDIGHTVAETSQEVGWLYAHKGEGGPCKPRTRFALRAHKDRVRMPDSDHWHAHARLLSCWYQSPLTAALHDTVKALPCLE